MAGGEEAMYKFTGWKYHFNSFTERGRFNWVVGTYAGVGVLYLLYKMKNRNKAVAAPKK